MTSVLKEETIKVPMLKADGSNWIIYKSRIELAAEAQGLRGYLTGTKVLPRHPQTGKDDTWTLNKDKQKLIDEYDKAEPKWTKENAKVKQIITASTPDTLYMQKALPHSFGKKSFAAMELSPRLSLTMVVKSRAHSRNSCNAIPLPIFAFPHIIPKPMEL